jgi:hypothetical protein
LCNFRDSEGERRFLTNLLFIRSYIIDGRLTKCDEMKLTEEHGIARGETFLSGTLSTTNPTWTVLGVILKLNAEVLGRRTSHQKSRMDWSWFDLER